MSTISDRDRFDQISSFSILATIRSLIARSLRHQTFYQNLIDFYLGCGFLVFWSKNQKTRAQIFKKPKNQSFQKSSLCVSRNTTPDSRCFLTSCSETFDETRIDRTFDELLGNHLVHPPRPIDTL